MKRYIWIAACLFCLQANAQDGNKPRLASDSPARPDSAKPAAQSANAKKTPVSAEAVTVTPSQPNAAPQKKPATPASASKLPSGQKVH